MSTFGSLDIARRALSAAQTSIDVTGHNIANANTPGYTRQRLTTQAVEASVGYSRFLSNVKGITGGGVEIITVDQIRNPFLDRQYQKENSLYNEWNTRAESLGYIEKLFDEMSNTGLSDAMNEFAASIQEVSKNPVNREYRTNMMQNAVKLTETVKNYAETLVDKQADLNNTVAIMTTQLNDITRSIADINLQISQYELSGQKANDLRDKRSLLLDELSDIVPIQISENSKGQIKIVTGGDPACTLVDNATSYSLNVVKDQTNSITGAEDDLYSIYWDDTDVPVEISGGKLKAYLDMRDGNTTTNIGIPYLKAQLDRFVQAMAQEFNAVHESGWSMYDAGMNLPSMSGIPFFTDSTGSTADLDSLNIFVNPDIIENSYKIALSSAEITSDYEKANNAGALKLISLFSRADIPDIGGFNTFIESFIGEIAVEVSHSEARLEGQANLLDSIDTQRQSISGVSIDEEMTNLMKFQHSYSAAARVITAIDEMIDVLINRTGTVGR